MFSSLLANTLLGFGGQLGCDGDLLLMLRCSVTFTLVGGAIGGRGADVDGRAIPEENVLLHQP